MESEVEAAAAALLKAFPLGKVSQPKAVTDEVDAVQAIRSADSTSSDLADGTDGARSATFPRGEG